ncbi:MAG: hypothetical protein WAW07_07760 [Bacteroidales bacterium]
MDKSVLIAGAGPGGLAAALRSARARSYTKYALKGDPVAKWKELVSLFDIGTVCINPEPVVMPLPGSGYSIWKPGRRSMIRKKLT